MRFERGSPASFFKRTDDAEAVLAERRHWLDIEPEICTAMAPEGAPLLAEVLELADNWGTLPPGNDIESVLSLPALEQCRWLCERWEKDFLLLMPDTDGSFRLRGGGLCFPSHWDLHSKMGCTLSKIHVPVPGLNDALGKSIDGFLSKIRPGISWERHNWGLSRSPELNQHPSRKLDRLDETVTLGEVWWRLEDQSLVALPKSGGVLFGIRVTVHPLSEVRADPAARAGLQQALETMPEEMAAYKGISRARERICMLLNNL
ncbi:MAG: heme-dependent oxidative N-demethylase subunit alpha family protein [Puniceicoccaceae bacterium]